jgi:predicted porin
MKTTLSVLFSLVCIVAFSQGADDYYSPVKPKVQLKDRVSGAVMAGTSLSFAAGSKNPAVTTFIAPKFNYQLSSKFSLTAGLIHYTIAPNTSYVINRSEMLTNGSGRNASGNLVFAGAEYKLNKKVLLSGAVMMDAGGVNERKNNYKAVAFGMDYKVSEHSSIGFRASVSQGSTDYIFDPKRGSYEYQPFSNTSFGNIFTGLGQWGTNELNRSIR